MFIFANTFELLHTRLLGSLAYDNFGLYPVLQVLADTVAHLPKQAFDSERASIDDHIKVLILRG
jgi:hypothetical protein